MKSPMAQKTNSKEQFYLTFYRFRVSLFTFLRGGAGCLSIDAALLFILEVVKTFPTFETNLLILKGAQLSIVSTACRYFQRLSP